MKKVITKLINIVSIVIILLSVCILLIVITTPKDKTPNLFGYSVFRVLSGSMEPTIATDSVIVVKRVDAKQIKEGDIISFYSTDPSLGGAVNTHRVASVIEKDQRIYFETKGDANVQQDNYLAEDCYLIGKVIFHSKRIGVIVHLLSNPLVFVPLIVVPLLMIVGSNLINAMKLAKQIAVEEENEERKELREAVVALQEAKKAKLAAEEALLEAKRANEAKDEKKADLEQSDAIEIEK